jgi:hypothetical protein
MTKHWRWRKLKTDAGTRLHFSPVTSLAGLESLLQLGSLELQILQADLPLHQPQLSLLFSDLSV